MCANVRVWCVFSVLCLTDVYMNVFLYHTKVLLLVVLRGQ